MNGPGEPPARALAVEDVPIIDVAPLRDGSDAEGVGRRLAWAASEVGFIYVANHGVDAAVTGTARKAALAFFRLPDEAKREAGSNRHHHGYLRPGSTEMYDGAEPDLKESFNWGIELDAGTLAAEAHNPLIGPNRWPAAMPSLRPGVYPYFEAASACAEDLLRGFALGAGLPDDHFIRHRDRPVSRGSLQYYPPLPAGTADGRFGVAPHTDFGMLTVLCQDMNGGLELQMLDGTWAAVPPIEGALVVNVGDLLERWSNGRFRSTPHRVINSSGRERLSLVLAYDPNYETRLAPEAFCGPGERPKAEPVTCGDYLMWRFRKAFAYRR